MLTIKTNIGEVVARLEIKLSALADKDKMLRACAVGILPVVKTRIHEEGKDASGGQIGTYSPGYMKVRTGNFKNATKFTRGKNKGKNKDSGVVTRRRVDTPFGKSRFATIDIESEGIARPRYNRTSDTKVVASLTRQMENDFSVIPTDDGYGLGYNNPYNRQKSDWVEETYKKEIFSLTTEEKALVVEIAKEYISDNDLI
jgi:hypothetical protein